MSSSVASGTLSSAGAGASLGTAIYPGIGTAIGAVVGAVVGAVGGSLTGNKAAKAVKYQRMAKAVQKEREENTTYAQYLQYIREARIARAQSVQAAANAGVGLSSLSEGAVANIGSQVAFTTQYAAEDWRLNKLYNRYVELSGKNAANAEKFGAMHSALDSVVSSAGSMMSSFKDSGSKKNDIKGDFWQANPNASSLKLDSLTTTVNV